MHQSGGVFFFLVIIHLFGIDGIWHLFEHCGGRKQELKRRLELLKVTFLKVYVHIWICGNGIDGERRWLP